MNVRGYYGEFDNTSTDVNLIGYGLSEKQPLTVDDKENYNTGKDRLVQCMVDILDTPKGTRFFKPAYGSNLYRVLFEQNDFIAQDMVKLFVRQAIEEWEPRVRLIDVKTSIDSKNRHIINVGVYYKIKDSTNIESFVYSFNRQVPEL